MRIALGLILLLLLALRATAAVDDRVTIDEPRAYGYVIGDLISRQVRLALPAGATLAPEALPRPGRIDNWLELHSLQVGAADGRTTLRLNYQVVNIAPEVVTTALPALKLALAGGGKDEAIELPDWPVHLSPLTPPFEVARAGLDALQPDIAPRREDLAPTLARLAAWAALALMLAAPLLLARWPQLAFWRRRAPFLAAWRELRRLPAQGDAARQAMTRLHAAFDASAGCTVFAQQLGPLYRACPSLQAASAEIDAFFAASRRVFFAEVAGSEVERQSGVAEQTPLTAPIKAQSTAIARAMASICNAEWGRQRGMSGHVGLPLNLSGDDDTAATWSLADAQALAFKLAQLEARR